MKVLDVDGLRRVASNVKDKIAEEADARKDADTSLGTRIGNVETDLTGIKGLTYGTNASKLVDVADGSYCSPALDEIQHEIEDGSVTWLDADNLPDNAFELLSKVWPRCGVYKTTVPCHPAFKDDTDMYFSSTRPRASQPQNPTFAYIMVHSDNSVSIGNYSLNPTIRVPLGGTTSDTRWNLINTYATNVLSSYGTRAMRFERRDNNIVYMTNVWTDESTTANSNGESLFAYIDVAKLDTENKTKEFNTVQLVPHRYFDFTHLKDKPFSTIGSGLKVEDDALKVDTSVLPSSVTVYNIADYDAIELIDIIGAEWPNCALYSSELDITLWPAYECKMVYNGYAFTGTYAGQFNAMNSMSTTAINVLAVVQNNTGNITYLTTNLLCSDSKWGDIEQCDISS